MRQPRTFEVLVSPFDEADYGVELLVTSNGHSQSLARLEGKQLQRLRQAVLAAVTSSKQPRTALSPTRRAPVRLTEAAGVRLALAAMATKPISKPARVEKVRHGIDTMTSEEALYWYARCTGPAGARALRALRILLAEE
ncbi:MAG: hypothetical protein WD313_00075 [Acidimicrobiia bacterium]